MGNTMVKLDMLLSTKTYYTDNTITLSDLAPMSRTPNSFMVQLVKCYGALFVPFEKNKMNTATNVCIELKM